VWILCLILLGAVLGIIARWIIPGVAPAGVGGDIIVGIVGSLIGGWLFRHFGHSSVTLGSFVSAFVVAVVLLRALRAVRSRPAV